MLQKITNKMKDRFSVCPKIKLVVSVTAIVALALVIAVIIAAISGNGIRIGFSFEF